MSLSALYSQLNAAKRELAENVRKLERLKPARTALKHRLSRVEVNAQEQKRAFHTESTYCGWSGVTQMETQDMLAYGIGSAYSHYIIQVDNALDEFNETIKYLEHRNRDLNNRIQMLTAMIRELQEASDG